MAERAIEFGLFVNPSAESYRHALEIVRAAEQGGIDLIGIQDHPYQHRFLDTWLLIADLLARTERLRFFPNVANLPLRLPTLMAKQAASLDVMSGGRFELGLGADAAELRGRTMVGGSEVPAAGWTETWAGWVDELSAPPSILPAESVAQVEGLVAEVVPAVRH